VSRVTSSSRYISRSERVPLDRSVIFLLNGATGDASICSSSILMIVISGVDEREPETLMIRGGEDILFASREDEAKTREKSDLVGVGKSEGKEGLYIL
jgi:hypothetical protein